MTPPINPLSGLEGVDQPRDSSQLHDHVSRQNVGSSSKRAVDVVRQAGATRRQFMVAEQRGNFSRCFEVEWPLFLRFIIATVERSDVVKPFLKGFKIADHHIKTGLAANDFAKDGVAKRHVAWVYPTLAGGQELEDLEQASELVAPPVARFHVSR